jgi:hypothetical protein
MKPSNPGEKSSGYDESAIEILRQMPSPRRRRITGVCFVTTRSDLRPPIGQTFEDQHDVCPACRASMVGDPIPEESRASFGGKSHFSLWIGIEEPAGERLYAIQCPCCGREFPPY